VARAAWKPWLHYNLWTIIGFGVLINYLGWTVDVDAYRDGSEVVRVDISTETVVYREHPIFPDVLITQFRGDAGGEEKVFATYFYPSRYLQSVRVSHERIYAVINTEDLSARGDDERRPVPVLKYGVTPELTNKDFAPYEVNNFAAYDVYAHNVSNFLTYDRAYYGVSVAALITIAFLWISLPWGVLCLLFVLVTQPTRVTDGSED